MTMHEYLLVKLRQVARDALTYVGMQNYPERVDFAERQLEAAFRAAREGRTEEIRFDWSGPKD